MPKVIPKKLRDLVRKENVPLLKVKDSDGKDTDAAVILKNNRKDNLDTKVVIHLPITPDFPMLKDIPGGFAVSFDIWTPGSPMADDYYETDPIQQAERMKQMAKYLFDMAIAGATEFKLTGVPKVGTDFFNVLRNELFLLVRNYNADEKNKDNPIHLNFDYTGNTCILTNTNKDFRPLEEAGAVDATTAADKSAVFTSVTPVVTPANLEKFNDEGKNHLIKFKPNYDFNKDKPNEQAQKVWDAQIKDRLSGPPPKKVAIFYAANNAQAEALLAGYKDGTIPEIKGGGQAELFDALRKKIGNHDVRILPMATSESGGNNFVEGQEFETQDKDGNIIKNKHVGNNYVTLETMNKHLANVAWHLAHDYEVIGLSRGNPPNEEFSIGGGNSLNWIKNDTIRIAKYSDGTYELQIKTPADNTGIWVPADNTKKTATSYLSQNEYMQAQLEILSNKAYKDWPLYLQNAANADKPPAATEEAEVSDLNKYIVEAGARSIMAKKGMLNQGWKLSTDKDGNHFLEIETTGIPGVKQNDTYQVMSGGVTNFTQGQFVSVGSSKDREIIVFNTQSKVIEEKYNALKTLLTEFKEKYKARHGGAEPPLDVILKDVVFPFVRETLGTVDASGKKISNLDGILDQFIRDRKADPTQAQYMEHPIIDMDEFIKEKKGVCRHHGLLLANFLDHLQKDKMIPPGRVHHARDNIHGGAHVWVIYQPDQKVNGKDQLFLADSLWNQVGNILEPSKARELTYKGYGAAIANCERRFNRPQVVIAKPEPPAPPIAPVIIPDPPPPPGVAAAVKPIVVEPVVAEPVAVEPVAGPSKIAAASAPFTAGRERMLDKKADIETVLNDKYPKLNIEDKNIQLIVKKGKEVLFIINPAEISTNDDSLETFKAMLTSFMAANPPGKMPAVSTFNDAAKKTWEKAIKDVYPKEMADGLIKVTVVPPIVKPAPAVAVTTLSEPDPDTKKKNK